MDSEELTDKTTDTVISVLKWKPDDGFVNEIMCSANNWNTKETEYVSLEYVFAPWVNINQEMLTSTDHETDNECNSVNLTCDWVANPGEVNFTWFVNGVELHNVKKHVC